MKEDIWDIKDQSKNLIKKLKSKCGYGYAYCSYISLANHIANIHEQIPCSICGEMISKKRETRHFQQKHTSDSDKKFKCKFCSKDLWKTQDYGIMSILIPVKSPIFANFAGLLLLVLEIIGCMKEDIWDIKDQSKNLIKNLKSKCESKT